MRIAIASCGGRQCVWFAVALSVALATSAAAQVVATASTPLSSSATWPIELSTMADSIGFVPGAPHPFLSLGTEIPWDNQGVFRVAQAIQLDYRLQPQFLHGPGVSTRLLLRLMSNVGVFGELGIGAGYLMGFYGPDTWVFDETSGAFVQGGNRPHSVFRASLGLAVGWDFSVRWKVPLRATLGYDETILFNVAPEAGFPILPAAAVGIRVAWFLGGAR